MKKLKRRLKASSQVLLEKTQRSWRRWQRSTPGRPAIPKGLFLNQTRAQCSIYESGVMTCQALAESGEWRLDYREIADFSNYHIPRDYDFYIFNWHPTTWKNFDQKNFLKVKGLTICLVLEVAPGDPFVMIPKKFFDVYAVLDPTFVADNKFTFAFPRPLEKATRVYPKPTSKIPIIGSFGFATAGKGFELVVEAVNQEFDEAIVRINIPKATFVSEFPHHGHESYADYLIELCQKVAKPGIKVEVSREFMDKEGLISWLSENSLNCFFYTRLQAGLSATTDQAITCGRPLAVSDNYTFRHLHKYLTPYPRWSLRDSLEKSEMAVQQMQADWTTENFAQCFAELLRKSKVLPMAEGPTILVEAPTITVTERQPVLFVSHAKKQCGIYQYGVNITEVLQRSEIYEFKYAECTSMDEFQSVFQKTKPKAIVFNYYPHTMAWIKSRLPVSVPTLATIHETSQEVVDGMTNEIFDYHLSLDPSLEMNNPLVFSLPRLISAYFNREPLSPIPRIGSFGFGFGDKGFERLIDAVQQEFDEASIHLHMPFNDFVDPDGKKHALATAERCRARLKKESIQLTITHDFWPKAQLFEFLARNSLNVFLYDTDKKLGISSCVDFALAVRRPLALSRSGMFRHVWDAKPSIFVEDLSLKEIMANDIVPLVPYYNRWSEETLVMTFEEIITQVLSPADKPSSLCLQT